VRLKSIDQWYQVVVEYEEEEKRAYHVLEKFYKSGGWRFVKFNL
jgi:hypothetical protein